MGEQLLSANENVPLPSRDGTTTARIDIMKLDDAMTTHHIAITTPDFDDTSTGAFARPPGTQD